jgi:hypothetical protein
MAASGECTSRVGWASRGASAIASNVNHSRHAMTANRFG